MDEKNKTFEEVLKENRFLVSIETVKIKDFIFNTDKLKTIRGASYLLDYLNQVEVPRILKKYGLIFDNKKLSKEIYSLNDDEFLKDINKKIDNFISKEIIYIGAGNAKFFVSREETAKKICEEVKITYEKMAPSVKVVAEYEIVGENDKVWDIIDKLAEKTAIRKSEGFPLVNIDLPFMKKCDLSGNEPAVISRKNYIEDLKNIGIHETGYEKELKEEEKKDPEQALENQKEEQRKDTENAIKAVFRNSEGNISYISEATAAKIKFSNKMIKDDVHEIGFYSIIKEAIDDIYLDSSISDYSTGDSFIGLVYSDGDGLGDFLKNIKKKYSEEKENKKLDEEGYLRFLRRFSITLDRNTKLSLKEVLVEMNSKFEIKKVRDENDQKVDKKVVGEFLIVGGDDVCAVFPADLALDISAKFQKIFEEKMKEFAKNEDIEYDNITSSGGVVIAKDKTPIYQLFEQGIKLQKLAKLERYNKNKKLKEEKGKEFFKTGYTDFQNIGGEGLVDIKKYREQIGIKEEVDSSEGKSRKKEIERIKITRRPYCVEGENNRKLEKLVEKIRELKKQNFSKTKLKYIYELKRNDDKTSNEKIMDAINILSKMSENEVKVLNEQWEIIDKLKISMDENTNQIDKVFDDILDVIEMYDFVR